MSLYKLIKEKRMVAMKNGQDEIKKILTVLIGEVDRVKDTKGTEDIIINNIMNKMVKSAEETIALCKPKGLDINDALSVIATLDQFRPKGIPEIIIRSIVTETFMRLGNETPIGRYMSEFKTVDGMDMKIASAVLKELMQPKT